MQCVPLTIECGLKIAGHSVGAFMTNRFAAQIQICHELSIDLNIAGPSVKKLMEIINGINLEIPFAIEGKGVCSFWAAAGSQSNACANPNHCSRRE